MAATISEPTDCAARADGGAAQWILAIAAIVFAVGLCVNPGAASDLFWQLRTGRIIVTEHRVPHFDTYSWTSHGTPWVVHEWLSFVLFWEAYHHGGGFGGVWLLLAAMIAVIWCLYYSLLVRETGAPVTAFVLSTIAAIVASPFFQPRPQLFTYLFTVVTANVVMHARRAIMSGDAGAGKLRAPWLLAPLFALWANLHAGVLIGVGIVGMFAIADGVAARCAQSAGDLESARQKLAMSKLFAPITVVGFAATLLTPYSYHEYENVKATITNSTAMNIVDEWAAPNFHDLFGEILEAYLALLLLGLVATRLKHDYSELAILAILVHEGLHANRNTPLLVLVGTLFMARHIQSAMARQLYAGQSPPSDALFGRAPSLVTVIVVFMAIGVSCLLRAADTMRSYDPPGRSLLDRIALATISYGSYPERACTFIERERLPETMRMYNTYNDGGFLIWRMQDRKVFVDSRADVYFGKMLEQANAMRLASYGWRGILESHGVDLVVAPAGDTQSRAFLAAPDWALVYVDRPDLDKHYDDYARQNNTFVFIKREPQYAGLIARCRRDCPALARLDVSQYAGYGSLQ